MAKPKLLAVIAVVVLLIGAVVFYVFFYSKGDSSTNDAQDKVSNAPAGCPDSTSIVVKSEEAGTQKITTANSNFLHWREDQGMLIFTNYTLNPDSVYSDITGDKVLTVIKLSHNDVTALNAGTYRKTAETGTEKPNQYSAEYNISTAGLAGAVFDDNATVQVDYLGNDYVCGTVTSKDNSSSIEGKFIAKYINQL